MKLNITASLFEFCFPLGNISLSPPKIPINIIQAKRVATPKRCMTPKCVLTRLTP